MQPRQWKGEDFEDVRKQGGHWHLPANVVVLGAGFPSGTCLIVGPSGDFNYQALAVCLRSADQ